MATRNISITDEAYRRLANLKRNNESFSLVINRLTGKHGLRELFGVLSTWEGDALLANRRTILRERRKVQRRRQDELKEALV